MDEEFYRLLSTGLLGLIVLLLLFVLAKLGKLQPKREPAETAEAPTEAARDDSPESVALPVTSPQPEAMPESRRAGEEESPFEADGRWWFRRDGGLLVYDERTEQWVDPAAIAEPAADTPAAEESAVTTGTAPVEEPTSDQVQPHVLEEARGWDTRAADATEAPIPEPVSPPASITETEPAAGTGDEPAATGGGHWKCPACGVINGSAATSCRMCFAARP